MRHHTQKANKADLLAAECGQAATSPIARKNDRREHGWNRLSETTDAVKNMKTKYKTKSNATEQLTVRALKE
eukprot:CAMPEP_0194747134 /NCGR_PEP_ID=MMETSP0323_2-20130528/1197_1 /TAXON_ID=2866 ORGANISM="Crypthecodinium cohnii, Strain Seligo" /NCGR_SAMPLE_ID=MMETSP0323_2 /ASSEMBLY_ACC=CAM_ASM_000346 /LENGTH=71 /DNA_ID=CAMNT_0039660215 /DNA_START=93 /DNA_END=308 /DNA_ORIENTATION=-